jgi:hypothetical protein
MLLAPVLASAVNGFLTVQNAKVFVNTDANRLREILVTEGMVPTDGSAGAFGYGTITNDGDAIFVTTTHAGVVDSEKQNFIADPVFHNHLVRLGAVGACGADPGVIDITWQSPGRVVINNHRVLLSQIPTNEVDATHSITGTPLSMTLGEDIANVVSFQLSPVFTAGGLQAVCVTNIQPAENLNVVEVD